MNKKILLMLFVPILVLLIPVFLLLGSNDKAEISRRLKISNNRVESRFSINSDKDGFIGVFFGTENEINLSGGQHKLTIDAPGYDLIVKDIAGDTQEIKIDFKKERAKNQATEIIGKSSDVERAEYFAENTWMVASVKHGSVIADAEIVISKKVGEEWKPISQGSAIDIDYLITVGAPADLIKYVEGL